MSSRATRQRKAIENGAISAISAMFPGCTVYIHRLTPDEARAEIPEDERDRWRSPEELAAEHGMTAEAIKRLTIDKARERSTGSTCTLLDRHDVAEIVAEWREKQARKKRRATP